MTKLLQASDAMALVRKSQDEVVEKSLEGILEFIDIAARSALTYTVDDMHPNPDVQEAVTKKLEALGYKVEIIEDNQIKISWSK